jgi:opacity protein-like surface antigen
MKKKLLIALAVLFQFGYAPAQDKPFEKGIKTFDISIGLGSPYWSGLQKSLPINPRAGIEVGITDEISVGGSIAYSGAKYSYYSLDEYTYKYNAWFIALRGAYHFDVENEKLDPYLGASIGYVVVSVKGEGNYAYGVASGTGYGAFGGVRYYLKKNFGLNGELGYTSFSFLSLGISLKL